MIAKGWSGSLANNIALQPDEKSCVSIVGAGQWHEITIQPGTTAGDVLRDLNLPDRLLSGNPSADFFANSASV